MKKEKKRVGVFTFTCDEGCSIYLLEIFNKKLLQWLEKIDLVYFPSMKSNNEHENIDIAFVEGVISTEQDLKGIKKVRENSKLVIAMGTCAITCLPSGQRNNFSPELSKEIQDDLKQFKFLPKCLAIKEAVKVDDEIMGCPIEEEKFIEVLEKYIN